MEAPDDHPQPQPQGEVSQPPDHSEVLETIDLSNSNCPQQEELVFVNVDFEEIAQAVFGQLHFIDQVLAENLDSITDLSDLPQPLSAECSGEELLKMSEENGCEELETGIEADLSLNVQDKNKQEKGNKTSKRESGKSRAKEDKSIEHILKALNSLDTTEEKLAALCKKYSDLLGEHRALQNSAKQSEKKTTQLQKEKEQIQSEHSKAVLTRSRLESLCRELQRQNKIVKDESLMKIREEEERRKEVSAKFQTTLNEISGMMQENNQKCTKLREENIELAQKLKSLIEQYEVREQQVEKLVTTKEHEVQLAEAKLAKANMKMVEEKEKFLREKQKCLQDIADYQRRCQEMATNEVQLRTQLGLYTDKYEEFQTTLSKSNEVFSHFKEEMDKMSKKIKKLEKETGSWKTRWESSNKALLDMAADKQRRDLELLNATKKIVQLEKLCRALQTERQMYLSQLKGASQCTGAATDLNNVSEEGGIAVDNPLPNSTTEPVIISEEMNPCDVMSGDLNQTHVSEELNSKEGNLQKEMETEDLQIVSKSETVNNEEDTNHIQDTNLITYEENLIREVQLIENTVINPELKATDELNCSHNTLCLNNASIEGAGDSIETPNTLMQDSKPPPENETEVNKGQASPKLNKAKDNRGKKKGKANIKAETKKNAHSK